MRARKREILPYLERLRDEAGVPMVYVSHHAGELRRIATSVVWLEGGRVTAVRGMELLADTARRRLRRSPDVSAANASSA